MSRNRPDYRASAPFGTASQAPFYWRQHVRGVRVKWPRNRPTAEPVLPLSTVLANSRGQLAEKPGERSTPTCLPGTCLPALPAHHAWVQRTRLAQAGTVVVASPCCSASSAVSGANRCRHAYGLAKVQQRHPPIMPPGGESPSISSPGAPRNRKVASTRNSGGEAATLLAFTQRSM